MASLGVARAARPEIAEPRGRVPKRAVRNDADRADEKATDDAQRTPTRPATKRARRDPNEPGNGERENADDGDDVSLTPILAASASSGGGGEKKRVVPERTTLRKSKSVAGATRLPPLPAPLPPFSFPPLPATTPPASAFSSERPVNARAGTAPPLAPTPRRNVSRPPSRPPSTPSSPKNRRSALAHFNAEENDDDDDGPDDDCDDLLMTLDLKSQRSTDDDESRSVRTAQRARRQPPPPPPPNLDGRKRARHGASDDTLESKHVGDLDAFATTVGAGPEANRKKIRRLAPAAAASASNGAVPRAGRVGSRPPSGVRQHTALAGEDGDGDGDGGAETKEIEGDRARKEDGKRRSGDGPQQQQPQRPPRQEEKHRKRLRSASTDRAGSSGTELEEDGDGDGRTRRTDDDDDDETGTEDGTEDERENKGEDDEDDNGVAANALRRQQQQQQQWVKRRKTAAQPQRQQPQPQKNQRPGRKPPHAVGGVPTATAAAAAAATGQRRGAAGASDGAGAPRPPAAGRPRNGAQQQQQTRRNKVASLLSQKTLRVDIEADLTGDETPKELVLRLREWERLWAPKQRMTEVQRFLRDRKLFGARSTDDELANAELRPRYLSLVGRITDLTDALRRKGIIQRQAPPSDDADGDDGDDGGAVNDPRAALRADLYTAANKVSEAIGHAFQAILNSGMNHHLADSRAAAELPVELNVWTFAPPSTDEMKSTVKLWIGMLQKAREHRFRRMGAKVYEAVYTRAGEYTRHWRPIMSMKEFVYFAISPYDHNKELAALLFERRGNDTAVSEWMTQLHHDTRFPILRPDRRVVAFENCILNVKTNRTYSFTHPELKSDMVAGQYIPLPYRVNLYHRQARRCVCRKTRRLAAERRVAANEIAGGPPGADLEGAIPPERAWEFDVHMAPDVDAEDDDPDDEPQRNRNAYEDGTWEDLYDKVRRAEEQQQAERDRPKRKTAGAKSAAAAGGAASRAAPPKKGGTAAAAGSRLGAQRKPNVAAAAAAKVAAARKPPRTQAIPASPVARKPASAAAADDDAAAAVEPSDAKRASAHAQDAKRATPAAAASSSSSTATAAAAAVPQTARRPIISDGRVNGRGDDDDDEDADERELKGASRGTKRNRADDDADDAERHPPGGPPFGHGTNGGGGGAVPRRGAGPPGGPAIDGGVNATADLDDAFDDVDLDEIERKRAAAAVADDSAPLPHRAATKHRRAEEHAKNAAATNSEAREGAFDPRRNPTTWWRSLRARLKPKCAGCGESAMRTRVPSFMKIFRTQRLLGEDVEWIRAFMARLFFDVNEMEQWQVFFVLIGLAGTGKSTLMQVLRAFFEQSQIGMFDERVEDKFPLMGVYKAAVILAFDIGRRFNMTQGVLQQVIVGESVEVFIKGKEPVQIHNWKAPMWWCCNVLPRFVSSGGAMVRRIVSATFSYLVTDTDTRLNDKIAAELPAIIFACVAAFHAKLALHRDGDIWKALPQSFRDQRDKTAIDTSPLESMLRNTEFAELDPEGVYDWDDFKKDYKLASASDGVRDPPKLEDNYYGFSFRRHGILVAERGTFFSYVDGLPRTGKHLTGVRPSIKNIERMTQQAARTYRGGAGGGGLGAGAAAAPADAGDGGMGRMGAGGGGGGAAASVGGVPMRASGISAAAGAAAAASGLGLGGGRPIRT